MLWFLFKKIIYYQACIVYSYPNFIEVYVYFKIICGNFLDELTNHRPWCWGLYSKSWACGGPLRNGLGGFQDSFDGHTSLSLSFGFQICLWSNVSQSHSPASSSRLRPLGSSDSTNSCNGGWRTPTRSPHRPRHWPGTTFWSACDNPPPLISSKQSKGRSL